MTRIVPEKPTPEMLMAATGSPGVVCVFECQCGECDDWKRAESEAARIYTAMIQAAPEMGGQISSISTGMAIEAQARKALLEELIERASENETHFPAWFVQDRKALDDKPPESRLVADWLRSVLEEE
jgi:hypothetical protein